MQLGGTSTTASKVSSKDDCFVTVEQDAVLAVPFDGAGQYLAFGVAAARSQRFDSIFMVGARNVLFDNWAFVEVGGDVVRGSNNQFDAAVVCLLIGLGTLEAGQKAVVNIDSPAC